MTQQDRETRKPVRISDTITDSRLLVSRHEAAQRLSISERALDYLVANKQLSTRRIGSRVLIAVSELRRFIRQDHPESLAG
jgi:excisionase family DNA binding protein